MGTRYSRIPKNALFYLLAAASTLLFVSLQLLDPVIVRETVESKTYDLRLHLREYLRAFFPRASARADIVIVSVDERSLREIGRWPWGRDVVSRLVDGIAKDRPRVIGIDILFTEAETPETDARLAGSLRKAGNAVLAATFIVPKGRSSGKPKAETPEVLFDAAFMDVRTVKGIPWKALAVKPETVIPPVDPIGRAAALGHVYAMPDRDGVLRWEALALNYGDDCYPSLALQVARIAQGIPMEKMVLYGGSGIGLGERILPTDLHGRALINYRGEEGSFPYVSAADVLSGKTATGAFSGKVVLVGTSAIATYDLKVTPLSGNMPGVEKNATVVENILENDFLRRSPGVVEILVLLLTGALLSLALPRRSAVAASLIALAAILAYVCLNVVLLLRGVWANFVYPFLNILCIVTAHQVVSLFREEKRAREIRRIFSSYVSPKIVAQLVENPEKAKLGGERREVTVLFSDIRGFTSFSERRPPEDVVSMLNEYFTEMAGIVFHWDGTLDKFIGDAIFAFWGAPLDQPDHAERALRCTLHMSAKMEQLREKWRSEGKPLLDIGIGLNTGEVVIGNIGAAGKKMDYTVIGDHVNLGARAEGLTKNYNARIVVTEYTLATLKPLIDQGRFGHLELTFLELVTVKGREVPVKVYRLDDIPH